MGNHLGNLREVQIGKPSDKTLRFLDGASRWLELISRETDHDIELKSCKPAAKELLTTVNKVLAKLLVTQTSSEITFGEVQKINYELSRFETILHQECSELATYFVSKKRNYSTMGLIESAENEFPDSVKKRLCEQVIIDIKSAGRCIAFELGTSAGIHSYRALEAVALDYVNKRELKPPKHDLWTYLDMLEKDGADKNAIQVCQQLRKLRRNPVTHPEDNLDLDQGIEAFQLSTSAITALVLDMEKRQLFPNPQQH